MLEIRGLSVNYGLHRVLDDVSIDVALGEIVVILGANGAGKTTLLKTIGGIVEARDGSAITLDGASLIRPLGGREPPARRLCPACAQ
jgi:branched-chain amino acid transport system ATP-binding protein